MRAIGTKIRTVGDLLETLADTDPNTVIGWYGTDYEGDPVVADTASVDASAHTAEIRIGER